MLLLNNLTKKYRSRKQPPTMKLLNMVLQNIGEVEIARLAFQVMGFL